MTIRQASSTRQLLACATASALLAAAASQGVYAAAPAATQAASGAQSLPPGGHTTSLFIPSWDTNSDGKVPRAEYDAVRKERFATADEDRDGSLNADEYVNEYALRLDREIEEERKAAIGQTHTRFRALDKDGDGFVSRAEYDASGDRAFAALDHDKDGRVAKTDPETAAASPVAAKGAEKPRPVRQRSAIGIPSTHTRAGFLEIYDGDADGVVTREQYAAQRASAYVKTDANRDGKVDETEYVDEFADRLDRTAVRSRQAQLKQGHVRFESIDSDKNGAISSAEYFTMSGRMFERVDTNKDGVVSQDDPPPPREQREQRTTDAKADRS